MSSLRLAVGSLFLVGTVVSAQTPPPLQEPVRTESARAAARPVAPIVANADLTGTNGEIILDSGSSMLLRALGATMPMTFETNGAERMRIFDSGKVTIGSTTANGQLSVFSSEVNASALFISHEMNVTETTTAVNYAIFAESKLNPSSGVTVTNANGLVGNAHNVGAGTVTSTIGLRGLTGVKGTNGGTVTNAYGALVQVDRQSGTITNGYGLFLTDVAATNDWALYSLGADDSSYFAGNVTIGSTTPTAGTKLYVAGNIVATGDITGAKVIGATYQDVAEWVPATSDMAPGTVVVLNRTRPNEVMPSSREYDTSVAGVVSAQPGIILGVSGESKEQIATTGRVKVRVDASFGPIHIGDLLATSNVSGTARRSEPVAIGGREFHQPGTIIGKALENLESGTGEILVLLSLQ